MLLDSPQRELLFSLVEAERSIPREQRGKFMVMSGGLHSAGVEFRRPDGRKGPDGTMRDAEDLANVELLAISHTSTGTPLVWVTPQGFAYYEESRRSQRPAEQVESELRTHLESLPFQSSFPRAYKKWNVAEQLLWSSDSSEQLSTIGHLCREAMQDFAGELGTVCSVDLSATPTPQTVVRIRSVLAANASNKRPGESEQAFLDAILAYWGTVSDLVQRQEHSSQREGSPLVWEDARRVVFQSLVIMYEVHRAVAR